MRRSVLAFLIGGLLVAIACGGAQKQPVVAPAELGPSGGDGYGGDPYGGMGGEGYGGDPYGGDVYGGYFGGDGVYDCVSGVAECDTFLQKVVACVNGSSMDAPTKASVIDGMEQACISVRDGAAQSPEVATEAAQACTQAAAEQGPSMAQQFGCAW
jgi:hypothetical protein